MNATKILRQLELVLKESNIEVEDILVRQGKETMNSIVLDSMVSLWFFKGRDYKIRYRGNHVLSTGSLTVALDEIVKLYKYYQSTKSK